MLEKTERKSKKSNGKNNGKNKVAAFVNWGIETPNGFIKSNRGFAIFQNPEYPDAKEDMLIELAKKHNGNVMLNMQVQVVINDSVEQNDIDLNSIPVINK